MIDENLISDISYTSKDFNTIYPELLDLVKKLSNKWDPSLSNESDPGVLLLKLNAIIADKNNYNIDKNVLECFPLSVTQESNARKLYDLLGYNMHWYRSAVTEIGLELKKADNIPVDGLEIPAFTQIVDSTKEIVYTILKPVTLYPTLLNVTQSVTAIQGTVLDYTINSEHKINFTNLDNNRRLYFQENMIAENGIFIADASIADPTKANYESELLPGSSWRRVDNLAAYPLDSKVFQFGVLPNSNTCYIEFPEDIATLIGSGIYIKYTLTQGQNGNIKPSTLSLLLNDIIGSDGSSINTNIRVFQNTGTTNGKDPETIDEAYKNYKKTVGTFNNLVTIRDYENFIYNIENDSHTDSLISNVVVSDRTNDINYSDYMTTWYPSENRKELLVKNYNSSPTLNAYNIVTYLLSRPVSIYDKDTYNESFTIVPAGIGEGGVSADINFAADDVKSVQHDILDITNTSLPTTSSFKSENGDLTYYKKLMIFNLYQLKGSLVTYNKITKKEAENIEKHVLNALYSKYNSREVNFGDPVEYNDLVSTIQNADSRIKTVILNMPSYEPVMIGYINTDIELKPNTYTEINNELIARMVLSGNVQLFEFEDNFQLDFGQSGVIITDEIKSITSQTQKTLSESVSSVSPLQINKNEVIQLIKPSLINEVTFGAWVEASVSGFKLNGDSEVTEIPESGQIVFKYKDAQGVQQTETYYQGTLLESNIEILDGSSHELASGEQIIVKGLNQSELGVGTQYYFTLNNPTNTLELDSSNNYSYVLQENEYFIYTSSTTDELIILGSGTQLSVDKNDLTGNMSEFKETITRIDQDQLTSENKDKINWAILDIPMTVTELSITSLGEGTKITSFTPKNSDTTSILIDNTLKDIEGTLIYNGVKYTAEPIYGIPTRVQSRLFINANQYSPQILTPGQSLTFNYVDTSIEPFTINSGKHILFNNPVVLSGGTNIDVKVLDEYGETSYTLKAMVYTLDSSPFVNSSGEAIELDKNNMGYYIIDGAYKGSEIKLKFNFKQGTKYFIPIFVNMSTNADGISFKGCKLSYTPRDSNGDVIYTDPQSTKYNDTIDLSTGVNKSYILYINHENTGDNYDYISIKLPTNMTDNDLIVIGSISQVIGYNHNEIDSNDLNYPYSISDKDDSDVSNATKVEDIINNILTSSQPTSNFDWSYRVKNVDKVLQPTLGESYWNVNHIYNRYTLPKIDFTNSTINIHPSSLL